MQSNSMLSSFFFKLKCSFVSLCLVVASINPAVLYAQGEDVDIIVPEISQVQKDRGLIGQPQTIVVTITDDRDVDYATLFFRFDESGDFTAEPMKRTQDNRFEATVIPDNKEAKSFQYYIEAADTSGNITFSGYTFNPKTWLLIPAPDSPADAELNSGVDSTAASTELPTTQSAESTAAATSKPRNRTLYTVLGVLAAVVVVGAAVNSGGGDDGGQGCQETGCTIRFVSTAP